MDLAAVRSKAVTLLFIVDPVVCEGMFGPCYVIQYLVPFLYSFAIILLRKRDMVALF